MTRPTSFGYTRPVGWSTTGGDPALPEGQPPVDCCDDPEEMPDRALGTTPFIGVQVSAFFQEVIEDAPDWYYVLDEPSGAFIDSSGHSVVATETGTITRGVTGPLAGEDAITADTGEYLSLGYTDTALSAASVEAWIKFSAGNALTVLQNRGGVVENGLCLQLGVGDLGFGATAGQITAFFNATAFWLGIHTDDTFNDDVWHHVVATWSGGGTITTGQLAIYVDGVAVATTDDSGNTGSASAPVTGHGDMSLFNGTGVGGAHDTISASNMAFYPTALSAGRVADHYAAAGGATDWRGAGPEITDGDDDTCTEVIGSDVVRLWLGAPFAIGRMRLVIECETAGAKSYILNGATQADYSDAVTVATVDFTATGSFTADVVVETWAPTDSYEFWELTGDDETRNICTLELYEQATSAATPTLDEVLAISGGEDIADALTGANAPDAGNVFATMDDISAGGRPPWDYVIAADDSDAALQAIADAVCDGTADQTEINAAITAAAGAGRSYSILLLPGTYILSGAIDFTPLAGMTLGDYMVFEASATTLRAGANISKMVGLDRGSGDQIVTCLDLRLGVIDGNKASFTVTNGIRISRFSDNRVRVNDIVNVSGNGVLVDHDSVSDFPSGNNQLEFNTIRSCDGSAFYVIGETNAFGFQGNTVRFGQIIDNANGFIIGETVDHNATYNLFIGGPIEHNDGYAIFDRCGGNTWIVDNLNTNGDELGCPTSMTLKSTFQVHIDTGSMGGIDAAVLDQHYVLINGQSWGRALIQEKATPSTPASGYGEFYPKSDGLPYFLNDAGTEYDLTASTPVTSLWAPVMVEDVGTGLWYVVVTGDGDAVMTEVPL